MAARRWARDLTALLLRHCGKGRWREALAEKLHVRFFSNMPAEDNIVYARRNDGSRFRMDLRMEYLSFYLGEYEPAHLNVLLSFLPDGGTFLDVGANIGYFAVTVGNRKRKDGCRIHAFEPLPVNYGILLENIKLNHLQGVVSSHEVALSNTGGVVTMQVIAFDTDQTANAVVLSGWEGYPHVKLRCEVPAVRFDDWIESNDLAGIDVMKIDVEGHELQVFEGMIEALRKHRPVIYAECNTSFFKKQNVTLRDVEKLLSPLGYTFHRMAGRELVRVEPVPEYLQDVFLLPS
jgi:FkbM family methyltransferase